NTLLTFGSELIFSICEHKGVEVVILNKGAMQEVNGDVYSKDIQEVIQKLTAKLATKTTEIAKEVREDLENVYNKLD
ncbi:MAG: IS607 family transposase, partial [Succinivibrio sp.]|nr:IS607 family transposase [Succinivibrio sp.]